MRRFVFLLLLVGVFMFSACSKGDVVYKPFAVLEPGEPLTEIEREVVFLTKSDCEAWVEGWIEDKLDNIRQPSKAERFNSMETHCLPVQIAQQRNWQNPEKPKSWSRKSGRATGSATGSGYYRGSATGTATASGYYRGSATR